jgi:hypothetical protein
MVPSGAKPDSMPKTIRKHQARSLPTWKTSTIPADSVYRNDNKSLSIPASSN